MYTFPKIGYKICMHCWYTFIFLTGWTNEVSLKDILSFFTGLAAKAPLGFDIDPTLSFSHNAVYPTASSCTFSLTLPTQYHNDYGQFKLKTNQAFSCHGGFDSVWLLKIYALGENWQSIVYFLLNLFLLWSLYSFYAQSVSLMLIVFILRSICFSYAHCIYFMFNLFMF